MSHKGGNVQNEIILEEHQHNLSAKRVVPLDEGGQVIGGNFAVQIKIDSGDTNITYIGKAPIGSATSSAVWQVAKLDATGGELVKTWADSASFTQVFDNREALSYS